MITKDQLDILRDVLQNSDEDWLLQACSLKQDEFGHVTLFIEDMNEQDIAALFPSPEG